MEQIQIKEAINPLIEIKKEVLKKIINKMCKKEGEIYIFSHEIDDVNENIEMIKQYSELIFILWPDYQYKQKMANKKIVSQMIKHMASGLRDYNVKWERLTKNYMTEEGKRTTKTIFIIKNI